MQCNADAELTYFNQAAQNFYGLSNIPKTFDQWADEYNKFLFDSADDLRLETNFLYQALQGEVTRNKQMVLEPNDGKQLTVLTSAQVIFDVNEKKLGAVMTLHDISDHIELESRMRQTQKMEAIGLLTAGIAHDFNNILASIMGYTSLSMEQFASDGNGKLTEYLSEVYRGGERARDLIAQMQAFSGEGTSTPKSLLIQPMLKETMKMLRPSLPSTIELNLRFDDNTIKAFIDPMQIHQMVISLCINSRDAMAGRGVIDISVRWVENINGRCASCHEVFEGGYLEIAVKDTGSGIIPDVLERMFDPFFTTMNIGQGIGMGLSIVHGIVHDHEGHIVVETVQGKGTTFRILLLFDQGSETTRIEEETVTSVPSDLSASHILVVDDEESVARFIYELLQIRGYKATVCTSSQNALDIFMKDPQCFDLVITDQTMPGMTGLELAEKILKIRPSLPVLLCSGYSDQLGNMSSLGSGLRFLSKPVDLGLLIRTISELLSSVFTDENHLAQEG